MKNYRHLSIFTAVCMCMFMMLWNPPETAGQEASWPAFEQAVFDVIDGIIQQVEHQDTSGGEWQQLAQSLTSLEAYWAFYAQEQRCPTQETCYAYQQLLKSCEIIVQHPQGQRFSSQEWEAIALLQQARHNYRLSHSQPTEAVVSADTNPLAVQDPIDFAVRYRFRSEGQGEWQDLAEALMMHSGDYYQVAFQTGEPCYVYIFQLDAGGKINGIFPLMDFKGVPIGQDNPVQAGEVYILPADEKSFVLDQQAGEESIYFLAFREPNPRLEELYQEVLYAQNQGTPKQLEAAHYALFKEMHAKGISHVAENTVDTASEMSSITWQEGGEIASLVQEQKGICDGCIQVLTFQHQ